MRNKNALSNVRKEDLYDLKNNPSEFWKGVKVLDPFCFEGLDISEIRVPNGVKTIYMGAFLYCADLKSVTLPSSLEYLGDSAFENCEQLQTVEIMGKIKCIAANTFRNCYNLSSFIMPSSCDFLDKNVFQNCIRLQYVELSDCLTTISAYAFAGCELLNNIELPKSLKRIGSNAFCDCSSLVEVDIPFGVEEIEDFAFKNCNFLERITIPSSVSYFGEGIFKNCNLRQIYIGNDDEIVCSSKPQKKAYKKHFDLTNCFESIVDFEISDDLLCFDKNFNQLEQYVKIANIASKNNIKLTMPFICKLKQAGKFDDFCGANFKFFHQIQALVKDVGDADDLTGLLTFAYDIGCFSNDGKLAQKATEWLKERLLKQEIKVTHCSTQFKEWKALGENKEFSEFLFSKDQNTNVSVFDQIKINNQYALLLNKIYLEYCDQDADLKPGGRFRNKDGKLMFAVVHYHIDQNGDVHSKKKDRIPTVELFLEFFEKIAFSDVSNEEERQIADELSKWSGMHQNDFEQAKRIIKEYHDNNIPANILGFHLNNLNNLTNTIDKYKKQTQKLAELGLQIAGDINASLTSDAKEFGFDWLEKNDPMNFCLGYYCNCCATLENVGYGILRSNFVNPNVQNLVIKTQNGLPVAKSTAFINKNEGYVVFNTIKVADAMTEDQKDAIYAEFLLGIDAFACEYNKQHPKNPIKVMTVGMSYNDLHKQIEETKRKTKAKRGLDFASYGTLFLGYEGDWEKPDGQYKLWDIKDSGGKYEKGRV